MMETLNDAIDAVQSITNRGYTFLDNDLRPTVLSFADVHSETDRIGACLQSIGLSKGDRLAIALTSPEHFVLSFLGAVRAGVLPVPIYPPLVLTRMDNYIDRVIGTLGVAGAKMLLTSQELFPAMNPVLQHVPTLQRLLDVETLRVEKNAPGLTGFLSQSEDSCFLQFTSGSTSEPRGVVVTHRNLIANASAIIKSIEGNPNQDCGVSWLPLYHDMGLIGFVIASIVAQIPVVFIPTISFVKRPGIWMETVHKYRGTITFGPNFAFDLVAKRALKSSRTDLDLSCLRVLGCGSEPINPKTMENFLSVFAPYGLNPNAIMPCYGMAEATLAIAFDHLNRPVQKLIIDRQVYESRNIAQPLNGNETADHKNRFELVSCGRTFPDHEIRILDKRDNILPEGHVGQIVFKGPSVTPGYYRNPEASRRLLQGGWLHTGDLGFILDGDLYITGRQKDLVIINGRNYPPQAIEWAVEEIPGIRKGSVVAFSVEGGSTEKLIIIAETILTDTSLLERSVNEQIHSAFGLSVDKVILVARGSIPKTSSGKLQRRKTKALFEGGLLVHLSEPPINTPTERQLIG